MTLKYEQIMDKIEVTPEILDFRQFVPIGQIFRALHRKGHARQPVHG